MAKKKTNEEFLEDLRQVNNMVTPLEPYIKSSQAILCRCDNCKLQWKVTPNNLLNGCGCPVCGLKRRVQERTKNGDDFIKEMAEKAPNIAVVGEYAGARRYVDVTCKKCGHHWQAMPTNLLKGRGCPECAKGIRADKNRRTEDDFIGLMEKMHPEIKVLETYKGNQTPISFSCKRCGYVWKTSPSSVLSKHSCPRCAKNGTYTQKEFCKKVEEINPQIEILGQYQRSGIPVLCKCKLCGYEWNSKPNNILSGKGCPKCFHSTTSFVEEAIYEAMKIAVRDKEILARDHKTIGKELDIYIPELHIAFEPGSWKWHEPILDKDYKKRKLCEEKGIRLIFIYTDYPGEEPPFSNDCFVYRETIGFEQELPILKKIVQTLLEICNYNYDFSDEEWTDITHTAYMNSRRRTTEEFKALVAKIHPAIVVEGEYTGAWNKIQVKCSVCGKVWSPSANSLLQGHGCRRCSSSESGQQRRKSNSEFLAEMAQISPTIDILSEYDGIANYVNCKCQRCGYKWSALPSNLLKGKGCPLCAREKSGTAKRTDPDEFRRHLQEINPNIELLTRYEKSDVKVCCRCLICQNEWKANPKDLLLGRGCPKCSYVYRAKEKQKRVVLVETGQEFESIKAAAEYAGTSDSNVAASIKGKTKTAKGFHWRLAEDS